MSIDDFYDFNSKLVSSTIQAHPIKINKIPDPSGKIFFDSYRLRVGDYDVLHFPIFFKQEYGKKWDDILTTGCFGLFLISERMKIILEENKLTGWKTFSIKLFDKKGNEISGYHGLSITGRCGSIDYSKSELFQKRTRENGSLENYYKGLHIGLDKWDGSDFFLPEKNKSIIVTAKAADILKKHKISNLDLVNLADIELHESAVK